MRLSTIHKNHPNLIFCIIAYIFIGIFMGSAGFFSVLWLLDREVSLFIATSLTGIGMFMTVVFGNVCSHYADTHKGGRKHAIVFLLVVSMLMILAWPFLTHVYVLYTCFVIVSAGVGTLIPFIDSIAIQSMPINGEKKVNFVVLRAVLAIGFSIGVIGGGALIDAYSIQILPFMGALVLCIVIVSIPLLKTDTMPHEKSEKGNMWLDVLSLPWLKIFLLINLIYGIGGASYFGLASVYFEDLGFSKKQMGLVLFAGNVAEIIFFIFSKKIVRRFRPIAVMAFCAVVAIVRWYGISEYTGIWQIASFTLLHGITFALYHSAAAYFIQRNVPPSMSSSAQNAFQASLIFIPWMIAVPIAGYLYPIFAEGVFKIGASITAISAVLCLWLLKTKKDVNV